MRNLDFNATLMGDLRHETPTRIDGYRPSGCPRRNLDPVAFLRPRAEQDLATSVRESFGRQNRLWGSTTSNLVGYCELSRCRESVTGAHDARARKPVQRQRNPASLDGKGGGAQTSGFGGTPSNSRPGVGSGPILTVEDLGQRHVRGKRPQEVERV